MKILLIYSHGEDINLLTQMVKILIDSLILWWYPFSLNSAHAYKKGTVIGQVVAVSVNKWVDNNF